MNPSDISCTIMWGCFFVLSNNATGGAGKKQPVGKKYLESLAAPDVLADETPRHPTAARVTHCPALESPPGE